jgi:carboxypeptidase Q
MVIRFIVAVLLLTAVCAEKDYTDFVKSLKTNIEDKTLDFYHSAYNRLAFISDTYGPRMWGSQTLEQVIIELSVSAKRDGFDNVKLEPVANFTKWVRGREELTLYSPRPFPQPLGLVGLGRSISGYSMLHSGT